MTIGDLPCRLDPARQLRNIMIVGQKPKLKYFFCFQAQKQGPRVGNGKPILRSLRKNPDEPEFCNRASHKFQQSLRSPRCSYPVGDSLVKFMLEEPERHESIYVEQISHGNSDRISATCLPVKVEASGPPLRTGRPVIGSRRILTSRERVLRGVRTIRPPSTSASSGSPVRSPSFWRMGLGRTT